MGSVDLASKHKKGSNAHNTQKPHVSTYLQSGLTGSARQVETENYLQVQEQSLDYDKVVKMHTSKQLGHLATRFTTTIPS